MNMDCIVVTLDVSRLSDWLNADALCREKKGPSQRGGVRAGGVSGRRKRRKQSRKAPTVEAEARTRKERTENMPFMLVTLEVSRLSGWLNADAPCQVEKEA